MLAIISRSGNNAQMVDTHDGGVDNDDFVGASAVVMFVALGIVDDDASESRDSVTCSTRLHKSSQHSKTHLRMIGISFNCFACEQSDDKLANPTIDAMATDLLESFCCVASTAMRVCTKCR